MRGAFTPWKAEPPWLLSSILPMMLGWPLKSDCSYFTSSITTCSMPSSPNAVLLTRLRYWGIGFEAFLRRWSVFPLVSIQKVVYFSDKAFTTNKGYRGELFPPCFCNFYRFTVIVIFLGFHSLVVSMFDNSLHPVMLHGVCNVPEVSASRQLTSRNRFRHIAHELLVLLQFGPELCHWEFIVTRHVHVVDFFQRE